MIFAVHNHVVLDVLNWLLAGNDIRSGDSWERSEDLGDITPPLLAESLIPVDRDGHTLREGGLLLPAKLSQLGSVYSISVVVERTINGMLDPFVKLLLCAVRDIEVCKEFRAQCQVRDLIVGTDIVDLVHLTLVENRVECVCGITSEEVSSRRSSISVQNNWLSPVEQQAELWDDFWNLVSTKSVKSPKYYK